MKTSFQIQVDFNRAYQQAQKLENCATRIEKNVVNKMSEAAQTLNYAWKSDSAQQFLSKENRLQSEIRETAKNLRNIADDIRRTAKRIYDAEMYALRIAQQRNGAEGDSW